MDYPRVEEALVRTFLHMQYRKTIRLTGGEIFEKAVRPLMSGCLIFIWIINVLLYSVSYDSTDHTLTIRFKDWDDLYQYQSSFALVTVIGWGLSVLSLLFIIIAMYWQYRNLILYFFMTELVVLITSIILRNVNLSGLDITYALAVLFLIVTTIQALILLEYLWLYMTVPAFIKWNWQNFNGKATECETW